MVLKQSAQRGNFRIVLRFYMGCLVLISIGKSQTDRQKEGQTHISHYNIDIKGYGVVKNLYFLPNLSANSFITWRTVWEFEICA